MDEKETVSRKLQTMKKYVDFLRSHRSATENDLEENYELRSAIERNFHLAIESALDIGEVIISAEGFEKPGDYREVILILGKHRVIPEDFARDFARAAGFRNILVHEEVDAQKLHDYLQNNLEELNEFARFIARFLEKNA